MGPCAARCRLIPAAAVRAWQALCPAAPRDFDAASDALIELCAAVWWERYAPPSTRTGASGSSSSAAQRQEGERQQVVDVVRRSPHPRG